MIWNCYRNFNCKHFGRCIDWLRLAAQSLYRVSGHPEVFTAIIIIFNIFIALFAMKDQKHFTFLKNKIVNLIAIINIEMIKSM